LKTVSNATGNLSAYKKTTYQETRGILSHIKK